jgi:hypothetical protein
MTSVAFRSASAGDEALSRRSGVRNPGHLCASKCCPACSRYGESGGSIDEWRDAARHGQRYGRMT